MSANPMTLDQLKRLIPLQPGAAIVHALGQKGPRFGAEIVRARGTGDQRARGRAVDGPLVVADGTAGSNEAPPRRMELAREVGAVGRASTQRRDSPALTRAPRRVPHEPGPARQAREEPKDAFQNAARA